MAVILTSHPLLCKHWASVAAQHRISDAHSGLWHTVLYRPLHRGSPSVPGQQAGMDVECPEARNVQEGLGQHVSIRCGDAQVGLHLPQSCQEGLLGVDSQAVVAQEGLSKAMPLKLIESTRKNVIQLRVCDWGISITDLTGSLGAQDSIVFEPQVTGGILNRGGKGRTLVPPPTWLSRLADHGRDLHGR